MRRNDPKFPWRVVAISGLLFALLASAVWMVIGPPAPEAPVAAVDTVAPDAAEPAEVPGATQPPDSSPQLIDAAPAAQLDPESREALALLAGERGTRGTMELQLFLIVGGLERLIPVPRTTFAPATLDAQAQRAVQELIEWAGTETTSPVPPEASVREVWVSPGGIAYVDFDRAFYVFGGGGSLGELHTVYSVVATLAVSFPEIDAVQILIDGAPIDTLAGHVDLSRPLRPSDEWVLLEPNPGVRQDPEFD